MAQTVLGKSFETMRNHPFRSSNAETGVRQPRAQGNPRTRHVFNRPTLICKRSFVGTRERNLSEGNQAAHPTPPHQTDPALGGMQVSSSANSKENGGCSTVMEPVDVVAYWAHWIPHLGERHGTSIDRRRAQRGGDRRSRTGSIPGHLAAEGVLVRTVWQFTKARHAACSLDICQGL